ncbi:MAG TPA: hypothetical protein VFM55_04370 [Micromonosporaceae bacterium]|nr:hypothetical protein [Micromonosporaceae bacterium]
MSDRATVLLVQTGHRGDPLDLAEEQRLIQQALTSTRYGDQLDVVPVPAARPEDLTSALQRHQPTMLHLSGRGTAADGVLFRADDGGEVPVNPEAMCQLLAVVAPQLVVAVVNACWGVHLAQRLAGTMGCAIGVTTVIDDATARRFSAEPYQAIGYGFSVGRSFHTARLALATYELPDHEAVTIFERDDGGADRLFVIPDPVMPPSPHDATKPMAPSIPPFRCKYRAVVTADARDEEEARAMMSAFNVEMMTFYSE